jgi:hypothetical protein
LSPPNDRHKPSTDNSGDSALPGSETVDFVSAFDIMPASMFTPFDLKVIS